MAKAKSKAKPETVVETIVKEEPVEKVAKKVAKKEFDFDAESERYIALRKQLQQEPYQDAKQVKVSSAYYSGILEGFRIVREALS